MLTQLFTRTTGYFFPKLISIISISFLILFNEAAAGNNYYFSSSIGDDSRTSIQARNPATPWKTITKLNSIFSSLAAGDSVLFKMDDVFVGTITPTISGTQANPIIISSYGSGANPIINGFQTITGWTSEGSGIYSKSVTVQSTPNMVTVNDINTAKGRYPNATAANGGYLTIDSHVTNTSITDAAMPSSTYNWTGAELVMKVAHWVFNRAPITTHSGTTINYTSPTSYQAVNGYGYFIQQDNKVLDVLGEWTYLGGKLYMYFGAANPTDYSVKVSTLDKLLYVASKNYITVKGISFEGANSVAVHLIGTTGITINTCDIKYSGYDAVRAENTHYTTVSYCTIDQTQNSAFDNGSFGNFGDHLTFSHNTVTNTYTFPGMSSYGDGKGFSVSVQGNYSLAEYNRITNSGYIGITLYGTNTVVRNNYIDSVCMIKDDGAAIYTGIQSNVTMSGIVIENNIVANAIGNHWGTSSTASEAMGIYIDGYGNHVTIQNNTVTKSTSAGLFLGFYTHDVSVLNNTLIDNVYNLWMNHQNATASNYVINGNIFATTTTNDLLKITASSLSIPSLATFSGNYYLKPFDDKAVSYYNVTSPKDVHNGYSQDGWTTYDATAHGSPVSITPHTINSLIGSNKFTNGTFTSNTNGVDYYYSGTASLTWDNTNKINGGSAKVSYTTLSTKSSRYQLKLSVGALKANTKYILKYDILGSSANKSVGIFLKYSVFYTDREKYFPFTNTVTHNEVLLEPNAAAAAAELYFEFGDADGTVYIDNVEFYEADVTKPNPDNFLRFEYNATNSNKTITLDQTYYKVDGSATSGSITLQPHTSVILLKSGETNPNKVPTIQNQNFQLNENSLNGTSVGTVIASDPDAGQTKTFSIISGNTNGAFTINASTGVITVAISAALNFEVTPTLALIVKVQDNGAGNLSSQATISIQLLNVNELPALNNQTFSIALNPANGTIVGTIIATDPDAGQTKTFSILSGNTNGAFTINQSTGVISVANSTALESGTTLSLVLVIKVQDNGSGLLSSQANITVNLVTITGCNATGNITYQVWNNIGGSTSVSSLTSNINFPNSPTSSTAITSMEGLTNQANEYGARIAGYICAPETGDYNFWITSDNEGELWLSLDDQPANKQKIAFVTGATLPRAWNSYTTQKSVSINLVQGQRYYIEALMKEAYGGDCLAVGWLKPGQTGSEPSEVIPGSVLSPLFESTNAVPIITNQSFSIFENSANASTVGTVVATDPDAGQTKTFSIVSGNTNGAFAINASTGVLTVASASALNFEVTPTFALVIKVQDNGTGNLNSQATITVSLTNVNEIPVIANQSFTLAENSVNGTTIGTVAATDPDSGQTKAFSVVSGNTNEAFAINASTGVLTVASASALNFEVTPTFALVIKVQDNGTGNLNSQATITVSLTNVNEIPVIANQSFTLAENSVNGTTIGTVAATDPDASQTKTFSVVSGNTNEAFAINASTGLLTVANAAALNYEVTPTFALLIKVQDNGTGNLSSQATISVSLTNVNEVPVIANQSFSVAENSGNGTTIGTVVATDPDASQTKTFSVVSGNTNGAFTINASTGVLTVASTATLNFEDSPTFALVIKVQDNGTGNLNSQATITVSLTNVNEIPVITNQSFSIDENSVNGTVVGNVVATDPDAGQTTTFSIVSGNNNGAFSISAASGVLTVINSSALNFSINPIFSLVVKVSDNGTGNLFANSIITVSILPGPNQPPVITDQTFSLSQNSPTGTLVGIVEAADPDAEQLLIYSIESGNASGTFAINPANGEISVANPSALAFKSSTSVELIVKVQDNGSVSLSNQALVTVLILPANAPPVILSQTKSTLEHQPMGTVVGIILASDPDSAGPLQYSITSGNIDSGFALDANSGLLTINNPSVVCFEGHPVFNLSVKVQNIEGLSSEALITVNVADINETPVCKDQVFSIAENAPIQTVVGTVVAKDYDLNQTLTYSILSGNSDNAFKIDPSNGSLKVNNPASINFEAKEIYSLVISVQDNGQVNLVAFSTIKIDLIDVNESPIMENQALNVVENSAPGTKIGYLKANDPDRGQKLTYKIASGNESHTFNLNDSSGLITVADPSKIYYGHNPLFILTVIAQDNGIDSLSTLSVITINILRDSAQIIQSTEESSPVAEPFNENDISIYPNPTADIINIDLAKAIDQQADIRIFTMTGIEVYSSFTKGEKNVVVNMADEKPGTYVAVITIEGNRYSRNIVVQNRN